jgi:hypothetical protein
VGLGWLRYLMPPTQYWILDGNRGAVPGLDRLYDRLWGVVGSRAEAPRQGEIESAARMASRGSWLAALACLTALAWVAASAPAMLRDPPRRAGAAVLVFCAFNTVWVPVVANALELGENNRFRVLVEPLALVVVAAFLRSALARRKRREPSTGRPGD